MDPASILGILLVFALIVGSIVLSPGSSLASFFDLPAMLIVLFGSAAAVMMCFPLRTILKAPRILLQSFFHRQEDLSALVRDLVQLAEAARREGLLSLENRVSEISDPLLALGIQMAVDGTRAEVLEDILRAEIAALSHRLKEGKGMLDQFGRFAPAFGMIGTLVGLVIMLGNMTDPASIGTGMAVALLTTLYGAVIANGIFLPLAEKLGYRNRHELLAKEIIVRGVLAIQAGENPRVVEQKLQTSLSPQQRAEIRRAA